MIHTFTKVLAISNARRVVEPFGREVTEVDIVSLYAKMIDVDVRCAEVVGPSWTMRAQELAEVYGIRLREAT